MSKVSPRNKVVKANFMFYNLDFWRGEAKIEIAFEMWGQDYN